MFRFASFLILFFSFHVKSQTLIITDSHGEGAFGSEIIKLLEARNENLSMYSVGGSRPKDWLLGLNQKWGYFEYHTGKKPIRYQFPSTPFVKNLLAQIRPHRIIIELGTNLIWQPVTNLEIKEIKDLIKLTHEFGAECIWVGPPDLNPGKDIYENRLLQIHQILKDVTKKENCQLVPSWELTHYPENHGDGIHYDSIPLNGQQLAKQWAMDVVNQIHH